MIFELQTANYTNGQKEKPKNKKIFMMVCKIRNKGQTITEQHVNSNAN